VGASFHGNSGSFHISEALIYSGRIGSETIPVDNFTIFVERAVMAPDIPKINPDRYPDLGASAWL
jgi:hypothetical protein